MQISSDNSAIEDGTNEGVGGIGGESVAALVTTGLELSGGSSSSTSSSTTSRKLKGEEEQQRLRVQQEPDIENLINSNK